MRNNGVPFGKFFTAWFVFCFFLSLAVLGGSCYAVYWGLSIAEDAVKSNETKQTDKGNH